jgi:hypothetical protein
LERNKRYTGIFTLWFALIIILAHQIIPHDHHSTDLYGDKEEGCPVSHEMPVHKNGLPVHCHAFNDLTAEETIKVVPALMVNSNDFNLSNKLEIPYNQVLIITITDDHTLSVFPQFLEVNSFRAPPANS